MGEVLLFFLIKILGSSLSVSGKGRCHVREECFLISFPRVMDIIIIGGGICHCRDLHSSSQEFHRNLEVSVHLFFKEITM